MTQPALQPPAPGESAATDEGLARRLREARETRGLTQQAVSTRSKWADPEGKGLSRTALIGYEAGTSRPGARELRMLCQTLHVTPNHLLFGSEHPLQATHVALEGLQGSDLNIAVQLAFVMASLRGHERDALMSLALSLAGRQLGDRRLSGLRTAALLSGDSIRGALVAHAGLPEASQCTLEELAEAASRSVDSNLGTSIRFDDDGEPAGGAEVYPGPR